MELRLEGDNDSTIDAALGAPSAQPARGRGGAPSPEGPGFGAGSPSGSPGGGGGGALGGRWCSLGRLSGSGAVAAEEGGAGGHRRGHHGQLRAPSGGGGGAGFGRARASAASAVGADHQCVIPAAAAVVAAREARLTGTVVWEPARAPPPAELELYQEAAVKCVTASGAPRPMPRDEALMALHTHGYSVDAALEYVRSEYQLPPLLCSLSTWTADEEDKFSQAIRRVGKQFGKIGRRMQTRSSREVLVYYYGAYKGTQDYIDWKFTRSKVNNEDCERCHKRGGLLCCDGCDASFHFSCLSPPQFAIGIPEGGWQCPKCVASQKRWASRTNLDVDAIVNRHKHFSLIKGVSEETSIDGVCSRKCACCIKRDGGAAARSDAEMGTVPSIGFSGVGLADDNARYREVDSFGSPRNVLRSPGSSPRQRQDGWQMYGRCNVPQLVEKCERRGIRFDSRCATGAEATQYLVEYV